MAQNLGKGCAKLPETQKDKQLG